jgi:TolA-binding protein
MRNTQPPAVKELKRQVLPSDATPIPSGELARLQAIIAGPFSGENLAAASRSLIDFLRLPRSAPVEARARYYLGQTYYLQGRTRDALMEFLRSEDYFYPEAQPWLDACFEKLWVTEK